LERAKVGVEIENKKVAAWFDPYTTEVFNEATGNSEALGGATYQSWDCGDGTKQQWEQCDVTGDGICSECLCVAQGSFPSSSGATLQCLAPGRITVCNICFLNSFPCVHL